MEKIPKEKLEILNFQNSYDSLFTEFFANQIEKDVFEYLVINSADYLSTSYKRTSTDLNIFEFFLLHANESSHIFVNKESTIKFLSLINVIIIKYYKVINNKKYKHILFSLRNGKRIDEQIYRLIKPEYRQL